MLCRHLIWKHKRNASASCGLARIVADRHFMFFAPLLENTPLVKAAVSERVVGTVILFARPVFWRKEVGKGMWLRWWRCSWRTGMQRTTRVQNTAEITLHRLSATVTVAIIFTDCQVRRGLPHRISPTDCQQSLCANVQGRRKSDQRHLQMVKNRRTWMLKPVALVLLIIIIMSFRGVHHPSFCSVYGCCNAKSEAAETL